MSVLTPITLSAFALAATAAFPVLSLAPVSGDALTGEPTETTVAVPGPDTSLEPVEPSTEPLTELDSTPSPTADSEPLEADTEPLEEGWVTRDAILTFDDGEEWTVTITKNENGNYILERSW